MTPLQRRRVHSGYYRKKHGSKRASVAWRVWYDQWRREQRLDYARKEQRRQLPVRVLKQCFAVPCPPWQDATLEVIA
jgi:hypothetical protein